MKKQSQGMMFIISIVLSSATYSGTVPSCVYKHDMLPVHTYSLDFSCHQQVAYSEKTADPKVSLCLAKNLKHSCQVTWPSAEKLQAAETQILLSKNDNESEARSAVIEQRQQLVVSCQFAHHDNPARGLLRTPAQSAERCVRDEIIV